MEDAKAFAATWIAAWNAHDLDAVLEFFDDDVAFTSEVAARLVPGSRGRLVGKPELRRYWSKALSLLPDLHFKLISLHAGVDLLLIGFEMRDGSRRTEVLRFVGDLIIEGHGTAEIII